MNHFATNNEWQRGVRDRILVPLLYQQCSYEGRYVLIDKGAFATHLQRACAVDTIIQGTSGRVFAIEEKIARWIGFERDCYFLETDSCTVPGHESPGWMHYARADFLLYCFETSDHDGLDCHLLDFQALRVWFWPRESAFPAWIEPQANRTRSRKVPIGAVPTSIRKTVRHLHLEPAP